jgi:hypothetical protein
VRGGKFVLRSDQRAVHGVDSGFAAGRDRVSPM